MEPIQPVEELEPFLWETYEHYVGENPFLIEVTRLESGRSLPGILDRIIEVLRKKLRYKKSEAFDVAVAVSELGQNTFDHNERGVCGFLAMQGYSKGSRRFLEVAVSDFGDGIKATLMRNRSNGSIRSDRDAIALAIRPGVSEYKDGTRGTGLHHLLEIVARHEGSVQIRSGRGKAYYRMDRQRAYSLEVPVLPGVQVTMSLPTKRRTA